MNITVCIYILILLAVLLPGIQIAKRGKFIEAPYPLEITKGIQGYFALCILVHHVALALRFFDYYNGELCFFEDLGTLFVGFFFFCSGYGLIVSYEEKEGYLKTFVKRRVLTVLVPFFICNYAYMFTTLLLGHRFSMKQLVEAFFGLLLLNDHMWFAVEIMFLYMLFYFVFRYAESETIRYFIIGIGILLMIGLSFFLGHNLEGQEQAGWFKGEWWYNTTPLFFVGMLGGRFREPLQQFAKKYYRILLPVVLICFLGFYRLTMYMLDTRGYWTETADNMAYGDKIITLSVQVPMVIFFEVLVLLIMLKIRFQNRALKFLGKISLEIILLEKVFMLLFSEMGIKLNTNLYCVLVIAATVVVAVCINKIKLIILEKK